MILVGSFEELGEDLVLECLILGFLVALKCQEAGEVYQLVFCLYFLHEVLELLE